MQLPVWPFSRRWRRYTRAMIEQALGSKITPEMVAAAVAGHEPRLKLYRSANEKRHAATPEPAHASI